MVWHPKQAPLWVQPFTTIADYTFAVAIPAHMYLGARSILIDYVPDAAIQKMAIAAMAGVSVLTAFGLVKLAFTDVGLVEGFKLLWTEPAAE